MGEGEVICPKTEGAGDPVWTFLDLLSDNPPVSEKYPTAKAASTSPIVTSLNHLGVSIGAILSQDYKFDNNDFILLIVSSSPKILILSKRGGVTNCPEMATLIN